MFGDVTVHNFPLSNNLKLKFSYDVNNIIGLECKNE